MSFTEFIKPKYFVSTAGGGLTALAAIYVFDKTVIRIIPEIQQFFSWELNFIIPIFLMAYMIAYLHERIPPCPTKFINKIPRFAGMVFLFVFFVLLIFSRPIYIDQWVFQIALAFALSFIPSAVIDWILYQYEPGRTVHYGKK